ncbi:MAG: aspartate kinase [Campylobacterales bacterium]
MIVSKFGGSSVANATQIKKVAQIVKSNGSRKIIVVSAPGKDIEEREKITDHLLNISTDGEHFRNERKEISAEKSKEAVLVKFQNVIHELKVDAKEILESLKKDLEFKEKNAEKRMAFITSRGEHYNAKIVAMYMQNIGLDAYACLPEEFGFIVSGHYLDAKVVEESYENIRKVKKEGIKVVPGFYGINKSNEIMLFSRGGSDLSAGEIAYALNAKKYENWTDTDGVYEVDPRIIPSSRIIPRLTFKEIRLLSSKGFNVFHFDAMMSCKKRKIPINIRNTNKPEAKGTLIINERVPEEGVVGVAKLDNMAYIYLEKDLLGETVGFTADLLRLFEKYNINTYHYPTDKDDIAVLVNQDDLVGCINDLRKDIEDILKPDFMDVVYNLAILTPVGLGLRRNSVPIIDAISTLGQNNIPIEYIDQSPSQVCFHIAVHQSVADEALKLMHEKLL